MTRIWFTLVKLAVALGALLALTGCGGCSP